MGLDLFSARRSREKSRRNYLTNPACGGKIYEQSADGCEKNMGVFPSGQWGQTVNLLLFSFGGSNPPAPTKNSSIRTGYWSFCFVQSF